MSVDGVECRSVSGKGFALFATREFAVGSIIFEESPLVLYDEKAKAQSEKLDELCNKHKIQTDFVYPAFEVFKIDGDDERRVKVDQLFCPSAEVLGAYELTKDKFDKVRRCIEEAAKKNLLPPGADIEAVWKYVLIFQYNGIEFDDAKVALLETFSRMNHHCRPSAWHTTQDGVKVVRAIRALAPGDEISISYLGHQDLLKGCDIRNEELRLTKSFTCECTHCCVDVTRAFTCPDCASLAAYAKTPTPDKQPIDLKRTGSIVCQSEGCGHVMSEPVVKASLKSEAKWVVKVLAMPQTLQARSGGVPSKAVAEVMKQREQCAQALHVRHWCVNFLDIIARDLYKHVLHHIPGTLSANQNVLDFSLHAYPVSHSWAVDNKESGDGYVEAFQLEGASAIERLAQAKKHYLVAVNNFELCNGPSYTGCQALTQVISKIERSLERCASPTCAKAGTKMCARCKLVGYCSRECQVADWKSRHKTKCPSSTTPSPSKK